MTLGVLNSKNRRIHVPLMISVITWDLILIAQIELNRNAIDKASKVMENPMLLNIHIALALSTVFLYFFMIFSGRKLLKGNQAMRNKHKNMGLLTYVLRVLTYITSYFVVK
jgi:hypothetical protein